MKFYTVLLIPVLFFVVPLFCGFKSTVSSPVSAYNCAPADTNCIFKDSVIIDDSTWRVAQSPAFDFGLSDTSANYNFYFNIGVTDAYPFSNLFVFVYMDLPGGATTIDTVEFVLSNPDMSWNGQTVGDVHRCHLIFRKDAHFSHPGKYHLRIEQAMRMENLSGVKDVGICIERAH